MIFVTVGTQLPFDRLIDSVSQALAELDSEYECIAQVGSTDRNWPNMTVIDEISALEFNEFIQKASLVISHAGMGTVIQCAASGKPIIVMPRLSEFGEHRNDHQLDTLENIKEIDGVYVADSLVSMKMSINYILGREKNTGESDRVEISLSRDLVKAIEEIIDL